MKQKAFYITGVTIAEYEAWCKETHRPPYRFASKQEFFYRIRTGKLCRDSITGKLITKRAKGK